MLLSDGKSLIAISFSRLESKPASGILKDAEAWLDDYFAGKRPPAEDIPISLQSSGFERIILSLASEIPYGQVRTYGDLAKDAARMLGKKKMSAQAVGRALSRNPIPILIPCIG